MLYMFYAIFLFKSSQMMDSDTRRLHPRMTLISLGYFGDPAALDTQQLLDVAFARFKEWRLRHRIPCSQKRFNVSLIIKKVHGHYMTAKAYNGRVILEWLSDVMREVVEEGRLQDPRLPLLAVAMKLGVQYH